MGLLTRAGSAEASLSQRLKRETRRAHRSAEGVTFLRRLLGGCLCPRAYLEMLRRLQTVYTVLEGALTRRREDPRVGLFYLPCLWRSQALAADLEALPRLLALPPVGEAPPSAASAAYEARLQALVDEEPLLLVAHAYTRFLGDLSGGQVLRIVVGRLLRLGEEGLAYYTFPQVADPAGCKADFRARLDRLPLKPDEIAQVVAEAQRAFHLSAVLLADL